MFYALWEKFSQSTIADSLPDEVIVFCKDHGISIEYFIMEFI